MTIEIDQGRYDSDPRARGRARVGVLQVITEVGLGQKGDLELMEQNSVGGHGAGPTQGQITLTGDFIACRTLQDHRLGHIQRRTQN